MCKRVSVSTCKSVYVHAPVLDAYMYVHKPVYGDVPEHAYDCVDAHVCVCVYAWVLHYVLGVVGHVMRHSLRRLEDVLHGVRRGYPSEEDVAQVLHVFSECDFLDLRKMSPGAGNV